MELKCKINEKIYHEFIVAGQAFAEEFNETLDSGTISISHIPCIEGLKPYVDVYIWDSKYDFKGYKDEEIYLSKDDVEYIFTFNEKTRKFERFDGEKTVRVFYKHLLVDTFSENMLNVQDFTKGTGALDYEPTYEYTIQLMSETKGLEVAAMPNSSVTEPLSFKNKVSVWEYLNRYVDMYSPVYKVKEDTEYFDKAWVFKRKYSISPSLKETFESVYSPDFSLNNTNLKEIISKLMITKDRIPYVINGVIYGMDITKREEDFDINLGHINYITSNMSSSDFCDNLKKNYTDALSQDNTARMVEYLGFRNSDNALMTLENMRLETRFPIYKINKVYMCYYKKVEFEPSADNIIPGELYRYFLCKQDITDLVRLNTERNVLSQDWKDLNDTKPKNAKEMSKYKMCTVGYDIGSKYITGWGQRYTYPYQNGEVKDIGDLFTMFWDITKTYLQNIFEKLDANNKLGIYDAGYIRNKLKLENNQGISVGSGWGEMYSPYNYNPTGNESVSEEFALSLKQKSFIFEVDYQAFYNGTVFHSKDNGLDDITINDNQSSSLTLLEQDGLYTKEKANRLGNKSLVINARYDNIDQLQPLGSVYRDKNNEDVIIYHREYQIWENMVIATYYGIHDYVLKNYFTSVYAKHRTWNLMPYNESVRRAENRKVHLLLSKDSCYYEDFKDDNFDLENNNDFKNNVFQMKKFVDVFGNKAPILSNLLSAFIPSENPISKNYIPKSKKINCGYIVYNNKHFMSDINIFVNGYSLCMNINMPDNISSGNYIVKMNPMFNDNFNLATYKGDNALTSWMSNLFNIFGTFFTKDMDVRNDYTGSLQDWYRMADEETGFSNALGIFFCHLDEDNFLGIKDIQKPDEENGLENNLSSIYENKLSKLPLVDDSSVITENYSNVIGKTFNIYKDNKELIDMTYQIEPITIDKNIIFSQWLMKLSDLISNHNKFKEDVLVKESNAKTENFFVEYDLNSATIYIDDSFYNNLLDYFSNKDITYVEVSESKNSSSVNHSTLTYKVGLDESIYVDGLTTNHNVVFQRFSIDKNDDGSIHSILMQVNQNYVTTQMGDNIMSYFPKEERSTKVLDFVYEGKETIDGIEYRKFLSPIVHVCSGDTSKLKGEGTSYEDAYLNTLTSVSAKYDKNMFVCYSSNELKKTVVYDEYGYAHDYDEIYSFYNVGDFIKYNNELYQCKFEISKGEPFDFSKWDRIENAQFSGNIYKITNDELFWQKNDLKEIKNVNFENLFVFDKEENNVPYIKLDLKAIQDSINVDDIGSIQYWFFENGSMHFVFGTNVSKQDKENGYIKVYCSILSTRDLRVYNDRHELLGNSLNYVGSDMVYGLHQLADGNTISNIYLLTIDINPYEEVFPLTVKREKNDIIEILEDGDELFKNDSLEIILKNDEPEHVRVTYSVNDVDYTNTNKSIVVEDNIEVSLKSVDVDEFKMSFVEDEHSRIKVKRTSSKYKKEFLGLLDQNSKIYYGDELEISVIHSVGYETDTFKVNGENWQDGKKIVVNDDINIETTSRKIDSRTWHVVSEASSTIIGDNTPGTFTDSFQNITLRYSDTPTRVSGYIIMSGNDGTEKTYDLVNVELPTTYSYSYASCRLFALDKEIKCTRNNVGGIIRGWTDRVVITKVEQFYES